MSNKYIIGTAVSLLVIGAGILGWSGFTGNLIGARSLTNGEYPSNIEIEVPEEIMEEARSITPEELAECHALCDESCVLASSVESDICLSECQGFCASSNY